MSVAPYDDEDIEAGDTIIRRINPAQHVIWDENRQRNRIASKAYNKSSGPTGGMSVDIERSIIASGEKPEAYVTDPTFLGSVAFRAEDIRALDLWIGYDPIKDIPNVKDNPHHGEVWATTPKRNFSDGQKNGLANLARWYVELPDVDIV